MSRAADDLAPPRGFLIAAALMSTLAFAGAVVGHVTDFGTFRMTDSETVESRLLTIDTTTMGSATVRDATTGALIRVTRPGVEDGFVWGAVNGLSYGRKQEDGPADAPYELARRADGRLTLTDLITGQKVFLDSFGYGNAAAFARLLENREAAR